MNDTFTQQAEAMMKGAEAMMKESFTMLSKSIEGRSKEDLVKFNEMIKDSKLIEVAKNATDKLMEYNKQKTE